MKTRLITGYPTHPMARTVLSSDCSGPALTPISELIYGRQARLSDRQLTPRRASVLRPLYAVPTGAIWDATKTVTEIARLH